MDNWALFGKRRFLPLFITQFFGAFNDNFLKQTIIVMLTYKLVSDSAEAGMLANLAMALFIAPYFLFSSLAGMLADKFDRARITRILKVVEVVLMGLALAAFMLQSLRLLFVLLFLMGAQSAFFSPTKYSLLPMQLHKDELLAGNGFIEGGTYLAILLGGLAGSLVIALPSPYGTVCSGIVLLTLAVVGYLSSRWIPETPPVAAGLKIDWCLWREAWEILKGVYKLKMVWRCILGNSAFMLIGALLLSQVPGLSRNVLGGDETVVTAFTTLFAIGIGVGSVLCSRLLRGVVRTTYVPLAALAMALFSLDIYWGCLYRDAAADTLLPVTGFLGQLSFWRLCFDLFMVAAAGGLFTVPLFAFMQEQAPKEEMARVFAGNNILNALFISVGTVSVGGMMAIFQVAAGTVFLWIALFALGLTGYACLLLPEALRHSIGHAMGWRVKHKRS